MFAQMEGNKRFELKYRISYLSYLKVRNTVGSYMKKDYYTKKAKGKGYLVRSLYYDTYDYKSYHEKMSGDCDRIKFRIRTYENCLNEDTPVRVELKVRKANTMEKYSTFVKADELKYFDKNGSWENIEDPVLADFIRYRHMLDLQPKVLIEYNREGYQSRFNDDLRITFDHEVRSAHSNTLFPGNAFFKQHHRHGLILEIKFRDHQPAWLKELVHSNGLKLIANSKFTQGIQVARQDLHHPGGVVVVR